MHLSLGFMGRTGHGEIDDRAASVKLWTEGRELGFGQSERRLGARGTEELLVRCGEERTAPGRGDCGHGWARRWQQLWLFTGSRRNEAVEEDKPSSGLKARRCWVCVD